MFKALIQTAVGGNLSSTFTTPQQELDPVLSVAVTRTGVGPKSEQVNIDLLSV